MVREGGKGSLGPLINMYDLSLSHSGVQRTPLRRGSKPQTMVREEGKRPLGPLINMYDLCLSHALHNIALHSPLWRLTKKSCLGSFLKDV